MKRIILVAEKAFPSRGRLRKWNSFSLTSIYREGAGHMFVRVHALKQDLEKHENFFVYGTGKCANIFYDACAKMGYVSKIDSFVVTSTQESGKLFHGIPVISVNEIDVNRMVFVAAGHDAGKEIEKLLLQLGIRNMLYMEDYLRGEFLDSVYDFLAYKDFRGYCEEIAEWYVYEHPQNIVNYNKIVKKLVALGEERTRKAFEEKNLVFIIEHVRARHIKFIRELIKCGYEISVLQRSGRSVPYVAENDINKLGIHVKKCYSVEEILYFVLYSQSNLFCVDDQLGYGSSSLVAHMIRQKNYFGKIIFDPYDIRHGTYTNKLSLAYTSERYAFTYADGIISRYLNQPKYLKENFHLEIKAPFLEFMDYCEPSSSFKDVGLIDEGTLRICWCVSHANEILERDVDNPQYLHPISVREWLRYVGKRTDYLIDIYMWEASDEQREIFRLIEEKSRTVHFFIKTPHSEFIDILSSYDYGMCTCAHRKKIPKWPDAVESYSENSFVNSTINTFYDFISSGVPIIASYPLKICDFLSKQYNCLLEMSVEEFDIDYLKVHKYFYKEKALEARQLLAIDKHINRLLNFLEHVRGA